MSSKIPLIAIFVYALILMLLYFGLIPSPLLIIDYIKTLDQTSIYFMMFLVILLESIVYLGFYLPGQFVAVFLIVSYAQGFKDILLLTIISILAVTLGAAINYYLGYVFPLNHERNRLAKEGEEISYKKLLFSMIHITTIALFLFDQGSKQASKKIILTTGLLNFPYYLLIIGVTFYFQNQIMSISENPYIIFLLLFVWLGYSLFTNNKLKNA